LVPGAPGAMLDTGLSTPVEHVAGAVTGIVLGGGDVMDAEAGIEVVERFVDGTIPGVTAAALGAGAGNRGVAAAGVSNGAGVLDVDAVAGAVGAGMAAAGAGATCAPYVACGTG
jgi:hypothetical protein